MTNEQLEDLSMFEDTDVVEHNVYDTKELSQALPFGDSEDLTTSSPSLMSLTQQRGKKR